MDNITLPQSLNHLDQIPLSATLSSFFQMTSTVPSSLPVEHRWDMVYQYSATPALPTWTPVFGDSLQQLVGPTPCHQGKTGSNPELASRASVCVLDSEVRVSAKSAFSPLTALTLSKNGTALSWEHNSPSGPRGYDDCETLLGVWLQVGTEAGQWTQVT